MVPAFLGSIGLALPPGRVAIAAAFPKDPVATFLAELVPDNAMTRRVAETLHRRPGGDALADALRRDISRLIRADKAAVAGTAQSMLAGRIREDFAHDRTVTVDGWRLSGTEARLILLALKTGSG
ncbi:MAG: hypothetical protein ACPGRZ_01650 [Alphaproteobacteria bacterium]